MQHYHSHYHYPISITTHNTLQVHDEVIFEGPEETVAEAQAEVVHCMENPWDDLGLQPLRVHLAVDADNAKTWYEAK
jgi:DNA polymerase I